MNAKTNLSLVGLAAAVLLVTPSVGSAGILASEGFDYNTGALTGNSGGAGWAGAWTAPGSVVRADVVDTTANPLSFTQSGGAPIDGGTRALEVALTGSQSSQLCGVRTLATPLAETFYAGYLVRYAGSGSWAGANNTFTLHLGTNSTSTTTLNFGLRGGAANEFVIRYGTGAPVSGASTGGDLVNGTTYYLVARVNWDGSAFTSANMWLNPSLSDDVDTPTGDASLTLATPFANPITHIFFREAVLDADDVLQADEIKIGTAWSDVLPVPEPSSMALLMLGVAGILALRRQGISGRG